MTMQVLADHELDLSDLNAAIRDYFTGRDDIEPDVLEEIIDAGDQLAHEVGAEAMRWRDVHNQWVSRAVQIRGRGDRRVQFQVTAWWSADRLTGGVSSVTMCADRCELQRVRAT